MAPALGGPTATEARSTAVPLHEFMGGSLLWAVVSSGIFTPSRVGTGEQLPGLLCPESGAMRDTGQGTVVISGQSSHTSETSFWATAGCSLK